MIFNFNRRTFVSLLIENLTNNNINYIINDNKDTKSLLIQATGLNCIELIELDSFLIIIKVFYRIFII